MRYCDARVEYVRWLSITQDLSPHTVRAYEADVLALERHLCDGAVEELGVDDLLAFIEAQRASGLASRSLRRRAAGLRSFSKWLNTVGLLDADPWAGVTLQLARPRMLPRTVASRDLTRLLLWLREAAGVSPDGVEDGGVPKPHAATTLLAVALMLATGLRVGEVCGLRHRDLDLDGRTVRVLGKGRRERHVYLPDDWLTNLVRAYLATRLALDVRHEHLLFNDRYDPISPASLRARVARAAKSAGVSRRVTPHMLRHSAATQLIEAGVDIRYIQRLLGHASLTTTEVYTHVSDRALKTVVTNADVLGRSFRRDN
jgi:site-specific recombinase XerD